MKITTNFVASPKHLVRPMAAVLWGMAGLVAAVALWLAQAAIDTRDEIPALRERLAQLEQRQREITTPEKPPAAELQDLKQRVAALNALSGNRGRPVTTLLADLERWLPDQVWLVSLHDRVKGGEVLLVAEANSVEPLTVFLVRLEQQSRFSEVMLVKQTPQGTQRRSIQFELRLKERS
jgi:Tfp pilus assembly protein PilN